MIFAFINWISRNGQLAAFNKIDINIFWLFTASTMGFVMMFLASGHASIPRRWAVHYEEWLQYDQIAAFFALFILISAATIVMRALIRLPAAGRS
jgi:cytochrome c oxidase subunit 1